MVPHEIGSCKQYLWTYPLLIQTIVSIVSVTDFWWALRDSNPRPAECKEAHARFSSLSRRKCLEITTFFVALVDLVFLNRRRV
jgi:hypothetical protein